ncbi:MAG: CoA pyrophosphatase [Actinomycetota bacterium]
MSEQAPQRRPGGTQHIPRPEAWREGAPPPWAGRTTTPNRTAVPGLAAVPGFADVVSAVQGRTAAPGPPPFAGARHSAVLVVVHDGPHGPEVLFTKRAMHLRNHRGEISFPGGRMDAGETAADTALREAWEEVALPPDAVQLHGELDHLSTVVSQSYIMPIVGSVSSRPALQPAAAEVDRILWVPLAELAHPLTFREEWWGTGPVERPVYFFDLDDETIWGATARILHQLLRLVHGVEGDEPPAW